VKCAVHTDVETNLRCGKCGKPICPKCVVQTPVGARCSTCANLKKLPVFEIPKTFYLRAVGAGLGISTALGALWYFIAEQGVLNYVLFEALVAVAVGYAIGEVVSLSVNRKRGRGLQVIGGVCVVISFVVRGLIETPNLEFFDMFLNVYLLLALVISVAFAVGRLH
jgi:hypothetical protein